MSDAPPVDYRFLQALGPGLAVALWARTAVTGPPPISRIAEDIGLEKFRAVQDYNRKLRKLLICINSANLFSLASHPFTATKPSSVANLYRLSGLFVASYLAVPPLAAALGCNHCRFAEFLPFAHLRSHQIEEVEEGLKEEEQEERLLVEEQLQEKHRLFMTALWTDLTLGGGAVLASCALGDVDVISYAVRTVAAVWKGLKKLVLLQFP